MFDLDGRRWGWLKKAAKWGGVVAAGACIVATAGACAVVTAVAVGISLANNADRYRSGEVSGWGAMRDSALDVGFGRFKAARLKWSYTSRYTGKLRLVSHESLASAYRAHPGRTVARVGRQLYGGARSYTGSNGVGFHHRWLDD